MRWYKKHGGGRLFCFLHGLALILVGVFGALLALLGK
jgi:hypothetical protein